MQVLRELHTGMFCVCVCVREREMASVGLPWCMGVLWVAASAISVRLEICAVIVEKAITP